MATGVIDGLIGGSGVALTWVALSQVPLEAGLWPLVLSRAVSLAVMMLIARQMHWASG